MSSILETITNELGGDTLASLGQAVGASPQQTQSMVGAALPALIEGLARNASTDDGAAQLAGALDRDHKPNLMEQLGPLAGQLLGGGGGNSGGGGLADLAGQFLGGGAGGGGGSLGALLPAALGMMQGGGGAQGGLPKALNGAAILGHIFGGRNEQVANSAAEASGVEPSMMLKFLPMLAPIVMSALGTLKSKTGMDAGALADMLRGESAQLAPPSPAPAASNDGFGVDDLISIGGSLAKSGALGGLFK